MYESNAETKKRFLTTAEAAAFLGFKENTLEKWRLTGYARLPFRRFGRAIRYDLADLEQWVAEQAKSSTMDYDTGWKPRVKKIQAV